MIEGALFDMDGVLVDSAPYHVRAWQQMARELGKELPEPEIRKVFGRRNREMLAELTGLRLSQADLKRCTERKEELYRGFIRSELKPVPGLPAFLEDLERAGIRLAVATSGPPENVEMVLEGLRLKDRFDAVVTGSEVSRSKPAPDIFLAASDRLGLNPERCVVFEDSPAGIEAAEKAGCPCIGVATTHGPERLAETSALLIIVDFLGISASTLAELPEAEEL